MQYSNQLLDWILKLTILAETGIICLDEFDKIAKPKSNHGSKDISGEVWLSLSKQDVFSLQLTNGSGSPTSITENN